MNNASDFGRWGAAYADGVEQFADAVAPALSNLGGREWRFTSMNARGRPVFAHLLLPVLPHSPVLDNMMSGGLLTMEKVKVIDYRVVGHFPTTDFRAHSGKAN